MHPPAAHYVITFKRPHWNNSIGFVDAMETICHDYKQLDKEERLWGHYKNTTKYKKHDYQAGA
jgi:hypothetical protein